MKKNQYNNKYLPLFAIYENVGTKKSPQYCEYWGDLCLCTYCTAYSFLTSIYHIGSDNSNIFWFWNFMYDYAMQNYWKMKSELKGASEGFGYAKTSLGVGFLHKNAYFLVKSEGICTINHVISYKRGGFQKPLCVIF